MQHVPSIHETKKVHILKNLDQGDFAYNSDDFTVPNVVAESIKISFDFGAYVKETKWCKLSY